MPKSSAKKETFRMYSPKLAGQHRISRVSNGHCRQSPNGAHYWIIPTPSGKTSWGVCRWCGESKEFSNIWTTGFTSSTRDRDIELKGDQR